MRVLLFLYLFTVTVSLPQCANDGFERFFELEESATTEAVNELRNVFQPEAMLVINDTTRNSSTLEESLYTAVASTLNVTETDEEKNDFVEAVSVITNSYFKACFGPEDERPSQTDGQELVIELLSLLANRTDFTLMREIFGKLLCIQEFKSPQSNSKRATDLLLRCARVGSVGDLYRCLDPDDIACLFHFSSRVRCGSASVATGRKAGNCLAFVVDTTGSMSDEIEATKQVITNFIQSEENELTLCYILIAFNDFGRTDNLENSKLLNLM